MVNVTKIGTQATRKIFTVFMADEDISDTDVVAKSMGLNRSQFIRQIIAPYLEKLRTGGVIVAKFDENVKSQERINLKKKEDGLLELLKKEIIRNDGLEAASVYDIMEDFAVSLGTDRTLTENIETVIAKLKNYECNGSDRFQDTHRFTFIFYLQTVVKRRNIETEIKRHWRQNQKD